MEFLEKVKELKTGNNPFTIILDDPAGNCFIYNPNAPEADPKLLVE
jgi:zinc finger protein